MYFDAFLLVGGGSYKITNNIRNWDDIKATLKRNNLDGVTRSFATSFEFVDNARALINKEFKINSYSSSATLVFRKKNNSWNFNEVFRCRLDFSTYEDDGLSVSLNSIDDNLAAIIKSKGGTEYEFDALLLADKTEMLRYDGVELENYADWIIGGNTANDNENVISGAFNYSVFIPLFIQNNDVSRNSQIVIGDVGVGVVSDDRLNKENGYIINSIRSVSFKINISMRLRFSTDGGNVYFTKSFKGEDGSVNKENIKTWTTAGNTLNINESLEINASDDEYYYFRVLSLSSSIYLSNVDISFEFTSRISEYIEIPPIHPMELGTELLRSMVVNSNSICYIDNEDPRLSRLFLFPAELIRNIPGAKIYSSFNKFRDWMSSTFGYVYEISGNNVTFKHRSKFFGTSVTKTIDKYDNFQISVDKSMIYSQVKAGYETQDYEEVNGRDEFHFSEIFTTGLTLTDASLDLISPYRADCFGFEILINKRGESTTDDSSDKNLFFMKCKYRNIGDLTGYYYPDREPVINSGVTSPSTLFNAMFNPRRSILANIDLISACATQLDYKLAFASSEGNSEIVIDGISEKADISLKTSDRIMLAQKITFDTPDYEIPSDWSGIIEIERYGETYKGYINNTDFGLGKPEAVEYNLIQRE